MKNINDLTITINNNQMAEVSHTKYLGIIIIHTYLCSALFTLYSNALLKNTVITLLNISYTEKNESLKKCFEHCYGISPLDISW